MRGIKCLVVGMACLATLAMPWVFAETVDHVAFQGRVVGSAGAPVPNGDYQVSFALFNTLTGGTVQWSETHSAVSVTDGRLTAMLGSITPFPAGLFQTGGDLWLEIAVDSDNNGLGAGDVYSPRTPLNAVPVAFHASNAAALGGAPASSYVLADSIYTRVEVDAQQAAQDAVIAAKANSGDVYTQGEIDTQQAAQDAAIADKLNRTGDAYVVVETTASEIQNGNNLLAAYAAAKALTPHGQPLAASNRAAVIVPPGRYDLGSGQLTLDTEFVDLIGLSTARENQHIFGVSNGPNTGVLGQTANDVHIENLTVECTRDTGGLLYDGTDPAAYFPDTNLPATRVRNCAFRAAAGWSALGMRTHIEYSGTFTNCTGGDGAFGAAGTASGTFEGCTGGDEAFGGGTGTASGTFEGCTGAEWSFGGGGGTASGTFHNCTGGEGSFGGGGGTASGTFEGCTGGNSAFGGGFGFGSTASGTFHNCTGGNVSFGGGSGSTASGTFEGCTGGNSAFGGSGGTASGTFTNCTGGNYAFGGWGGTASGTFSNCKAGYGGFGSGGTASGTFEGCTGGNSAFGSAGMTLGGRFTNCRLASTFWAGTFQGRMDGCRWETGITLGAEARIYNSTFLATVDLQNTAAGISQSRVRGSILNAGSATFNAFNLENANVE